MVKFKNTREFLEKLEAVMSNMTEEKRVEFVNANEGSILGAIITNVAKDLHIFGSTKEMLLAESVGSEVDEKVLEKAFSMIKKVIKKVKEE